MSTVFVKNMKRWIKGKAMAGKANLHQNDSFVNWTQLPMLCEKSGVILLVLVGLTAGQQSNEILVDSKNLYQSHYGV